MQKLNSELKKISFLLILLFFISCKEELFKSEKNILNELTEIENVLETKKSIIIIPLNGCGTCTQEIIKFSKLNFNNNKIKFILTGVNAQNFLTYNEIKDVTKYFIIDEYSTLISQGLIENKPLIFYIENNEITKKVTFDNNNVKKIISNLK